MSPAAEPSRLPWLFPAARASRLESKERGSLLPWERIALALRLYPGLSYGDLGAGPGVFTRKLLEITRGEGCFWAVEGQADMHRVLRSRLRSWTEAGLPGASRVETVLAGPSTPPVPLPPGSLDRALMLHLLHEIPDVGAYLKDLRRVLRPWGRALIVDWNTPADASWVGLAGPPKNSRLSFAQAARLARIAGFREAVKLPGFTHGWGLLLA